MTYPFPCGYVSLMPATISEAVELAVVRAMCSSGRARTIRQRAGLSQAEMARPCGVGAPAILKWENGERSPTGEAAIAYGRLLVELEKALS